MNRGRALRSGGSQARFPDFYIAGAPRSGTTFMYEYLGRHPDVFMPERKEPNYFCTDLDSGSYLDSVSFIRSESEYLKLFRNARAGQLIGEGSTWYLFSRDAAARIHGVRPDARIIIMLRDPIEMIYSLHGRRRFGGTETLSFSDALDAEPERRRGLQLPPRPRNVKALLYREVAAYAEQVRRYFDIFGGDQVHVIIFDDFKEDPIAAYQATLAFLGLPHVALPSVTVVNAASRRRSERLHRMLLTPWVVWLGRAIVPPSLRPTIGLILDRVNAAPDSRTRLDPSLRRRLTSEMRSDVAKLGELLGRDLESLWFGRDDAVAVESMG